MANKLRSPDLLVILRGLNAVSKAAINVTESELKEAWSTSSIRSGLKSTGQNFKNENFSIPPVNEVVERSLVVARGLKEFSIIASQNLVSRNFTNLQKLGATNIPEAPPENPQFEDLNNFPKEPAMKQQCSTDQIVVTETKDQKLLLINASAASNSFDFTKNQVSPVVEVAEETSVRIPPIRSNNPDAAKSSSNSIETEIDKSIRNSLEVPINISSEPLASPMQPNSPQLHASTSEKFMRESESNSSENTTGSQQVDQEDVVKIQPVVAPPPIAKKNRKSKLSEQSREVSVPSSRIGRLASYGSLAAGLGFGAIAEVTRRTLGIGASGKLMGDAAPALLESNPFLTEANAERIVNTLCKVRGAALKLGQMMSIQDNSLINPQLQKIFERVRQSADFMPIRQMNKVLIQELGEDWRDRLADFQDQPLAAASIGQVHLATLFDGREVAMKIQYPGVAKGIDSDINNLVTVMNVWNILPKGLYVEDLIKVAKRELSWEVDYIREAECTKKFYDLLKDFPEYKVPLVIDEFCTDQIFTTEYVEGISMEQCMELDQETRNYVAEKILFLCLKELFEFRYMQTDPNWANFMYNPATRQVVLLDFGASREFPKSFVDKYIRIIEGAAEGDGKKVLEYSREVGFLVGYESKSMEDAHVEAVMILGEAFRKHGPFDFGGQDVTRRIQRLVPVMMSQRLCAPPEEVYSLHRKMAGVFLLCAKLNAKIDCKSHFDNIVVRYHAAT